MPHSMSIQHAREGERARKGRTVSKIEVRDFEGRLWQCKNVVVIPIIIGVLGTISKGFRTWIRKMQMENYRNLMQKACWLC